MLSFTWSELIFALEILAETPGQRRRVRGLVTGIQLKAADLDGLTVLKLICSAAYLTQHENPAQQIEEALAGFDRS